MVDMDLAEQWSTLFPFLKTYGLPVVVLLGLLVGMVFLLGYLTLLFQYLRKKESMFLSQPTIDTIERILQVAISIGSLVYFVFLLQLLSARIHEYIWNPMKLFLPSLITIGIIVSLAVVLIRILNSFTEYLKGDLKVKPIKALKDEYINIVSLLIRYLIYASASVSIIFVIIIALGFRDILMMKITAFLVNNLQFFLFIILIIFTTYFLNRFVASFFKDLSFRSSKFSPQLVKSTGTGIRVAIYVLAVLLVVFAILNMANLGGISQTILLIGTTMIGLIVAMAGTGSIGNMLSGAVLIIFRPLKKGDRAVLLEEKLVCDVIETSIMFTKVKTREDELVDIPNNLVLASPITNLSDSRPFAISIKTTIGYDVHHSAVEKLMKKAASMTDKVLMFPEPKVFLTNLGNFAIEYELYAYTNHEKEQKEIRSRIMMNLQDVFYDNGVEIMSPVYEVERFGGIAERDIPPKPKKLENNDEESFQESMESDSSVLD